MLERLLSPCGFKLYFASILIMVGFVTWQVLTHRGVGEWVNRFQATYFFSGRYSPELTILILAFPIAIISLAIGFFHDYLTGQGIFTGREKAGDFATPSSSTKIEYQETTQKEAIDQVRSKFQSEIYQLKMLGFEEFGFYREIIPWFGLPMGFIGLLGSIGVLSNEVTKIGPGLTINSFYIVMASRKDAAYASVSKLGIKFHTIFADGTCLDTANYKGIEFEDEGRKLYRFAFDRNLSSAWAGHKKRMDKFQADGKKIDEGLNMRDYFQMIKRMDDYMLKNRSKVTKSDEEKTSFISKAIPALISIASPLGVIASVFFAFTFTANLIHTIYPTCWFVRDMGIMPLWLNFLAGPASLGVSWILARMEHGLVTADGAGTRLYGNEPIPNSQQFISTKWLTLPWIPLLPVRSYVITVNKNGPFNQKTYKMQPLDELNWAQVRETVRKSWIGYGVLTFIYIAFAIWEVTKCQ